MISTKKEILVNKGSFLKDRTRGDHPADPIAPAEKSIVDQYKFLFLAGLHKSGTSLLARIIKNHPCISGFSKTGFPQDEGQFLQSVFPTASTFGGPGLFGFHSSMHLTEDSPLATDANKQTLFSQWSEHWDLSRNVLLEKSPPNLLKTRFLQALFPKSYIVVAIRHPAMVSLATQNWIKIPVWTLLRHWILCYKTFFADKEYLKNCVLIRYEDFVRESELHLKRIHDFLGLEDFQHSNEVRNDIDSKYSEKWQKFMKSWKNTNNRFLKSELDVIEGEVNKLGYSLFSLEVESEIND